MSNNNERTSVNSRPRRRAIINQFQAYSYAQRQEWFVFPCYTVNLDGECSCGDSKCKSPGKHPRTRHGFKDATTDLDKITEWWAESPDANIGLATGKVSGIVVIDIDVAKNGEQSGFDSLEELEEK